MKRIILVLLGLTLFANSKFTTNGLPAGIVKDTNTKLFWQNDYSDNGGQTKVATWTDAIDYCEASTLGGFTDWRLPNTNELLSIVDYSRSSSIDIIFNQDGGEYWSSTTTKESNSSAWIIYFGYGKIYSLYKGYTAKIRCVR